MYMNRRVEDRIERNVLGSDKKWIMSIWWVD
jgi:hypothetical protein